MSNFYNVYQETGERFYRLPKVFFTNKKYLKMSNDSKMAYAILQDRIELSIKNNWIDEEGNVYFIFSNNKLEIILNFSEPTVIKIKKELIACDLLLQKRVGLNKPNQLYLLKPEVNEDDIYKIKEKDSIGEETSDDKELKNVKFQNLKNFSSGTKDNLVQEHKKVKSNDTELSDTEFSDTDTNDMHNTNNTSHANNSHSIQDEKWVKEHQKEKFLNKYPKGITVHLNGLPAEEAKEVLSILNKAKKNVTNGIGSRLIKNFDFTHEFHEMELGNIIRRVINEAKINQTSIQSYSAYLMKSFLNYYASYWEPIMNEIIAEDMKEFSGFH